MGSESIVQNWALLVAGGLLLVIVAVVALAVWRRSAAGRLRRQASGFRAAMSVREKARRRLEAGEQRLAKLELRAESTPPKTLQAARDEVSDATTLLKICGDRAMVEANLLRKIIVEEYPPRRQAALRQKYLPGDSPDGKPFSF